MTYRNAAEALTGNGYCPRTTGVDVLMDAPYGVGLDVAEAMEGYVDTADDDLAEGFQEADFASEYAEGLIEAGIC